MQVPRCVHSTEENGQAIKDQNCFSQVQCATSVGDKPVSSEISDLYEISDLLVFVCYFASQNKKIKFDHYFFDVCCVN